MSHKILIFLAVAFLIQLNCYGKLYYKSYGFIVTNEEDTIKCDFKLPGIKTNDKSLMIDLEAIQKKIISVDKKSNKEIVYSPNDIKSFQFHFDYDQFNFESKSLDWVKNEKKKLKKKFFQREVFGPLNMYIIKSHVNLWTVGGCCGGMNASSAFAELAEEKNIPTTVKWENRFIQKQNEKLLKITRDGFENELQTYLSDCPELINKIGTEGYKPENLIRIVMEYNDCVESKK